MAQPPALSKLRQDMPRRLKDIPTFANYNNLTGARGPASWVLLGGATLLTAYGLYRAFGDNKEREYRSLAKFNERFERAYVLQAVEEASWHKRHKAMVDLEREWMASRPEWTVNKSHYYTQRPERPNTDPLDTRTLTPWGAK